MNLFGRGLKFGLFLFLLLGSFFYLSNPAKAHSLKTDGSILIMLHANPDDDPIVGQDAELTFYISDTEKKFKATECDCRLTISFGGNVVFSTTTFDSPKNNPIFSYIFQQKGIYNIHFTANPLVKDGFQSFSMDYDMRVERLLEQVVATKTSFYRLYIILGVIITLLTLLFLNYEKLKKVILGLFILLIIAGPVSHKLQILCPEHSHGNQASQHDCCLVPSVGSSANLSIDWLPVYSRVKITGPQQSGNASIIFGLNNKSPPNQLV